MQNPNKEENDGKKRYNFRIQDDTMILIQQWYKADNCTTMNEFVEKIHSLGENVRLGDLRCKN